MEDGKKDRDIDERGYHIKLLPPARLGIKPTTQACSLTGNQSLLGAWVNAPPLSHTSRVMY